MTTDNVKQPPDTDRWVLVILHDERVCPGKFKYPSPMSEKRRWVLGNNGKPRDDEFDWREMPSWDRLAILDRYDEERAEWEAKVKGLEADRVGLKYALAMAEAAEELAGQQAFEDTDAHRLECALSQMREVEEANQRLAAQVTAPTEERDLFREGTAHVDVVIKARIKDMEERIRAALARADRAEKERDEALEWRRRVADALDCIKDNGTIGDAEYVSGHAFKVRKFAEERDKWHAIYGETAEERDRAIAERDDLGCQLEALRAVQRGDVADLRTRMEAMERWRADVEDRDDAVAAFLEKMSAVVDERGGASKP